MCAIKSTSPAHRGNGGRAQEIVGFGRHDTSGFIRHSAPWQYFRRRSHAPSRRYSKEPMCLRRHDHPKRTSRRQKYCSYVCRDEARRVPFRDFRTRTRGFPQSIKNNDSKSMASDRDSANRALLPSLRSSPPGSPRMSGPGRPISRAFEADRARDTCRVCCPLADQDAVALDILVKGDRRQFPTRRLPPPRRYQSVAMEQSP
jgi:hypothetical protein